MLERCLRHVRPLAAKKTFASCWMGMMARARASVLPDQAPIVNDLGSIASRIPVTIGPRFLELFSSNLYTSANKAFEELISNSWDAMATVTHIGISTDLNAPDAALWVLDNGRSMDQAGLEQLWAVGDSPKRTGPENQDRPPIGKFGIGKLATYLLANRLAYLCKGADGIVRLVEMDYERILKQSAGSRKTLLQPTNKGGITLQVRALSKSDLKEFFSRLGSTGEEIAALISPGLKPAQTNASEYLNEFGGVPNKRPPKALAKTWTLALMLSLKDAGKQIQRRRLQHMLEASLPLGTSMSMIYCGDLLRPRLEGNEPLEACAIGPELDIEIITRHVDASPDDGALPAIDRFGGKKRIADGRVFYEYPIVKSTSPFPHVSIGTMNAPITGRWSVFAEELTGKKADDRGRSHGYFINVRGRVVNADAPYFGLSNLNHRAWAHFRAAIRADWLDSSLTVNRESFHAHADAVELFRIFIRAIFNKARNVFDGPRTVPRFQSTGEKLANTWGAIPLQSLRSAIQSLASHPNELPPEIRLVSDDPKHEIEAWISAAKTDPSNMIKEVQHRGLGGMEPLFVYDLVERVVIVNLDHPVAVEYGNQRESKDLLAASSVAEVLSDAHLTHIGVAADDLTEFQRYRDDMRRIIIDLTRRNAASIATALLDSTNDAAMLEDAATEALQALGFSARKLAKTGTTDGIAESPTATSRIRSDRGYVFTYDAKASGHARVKTNDLRVDKLRVHREDENADYTLIIAPDYEDGQIRTVCKNARCTPIRARTLAKLLMLRARVGNVDLNRFESIFDRHHPDDVDSFVEALIDEHLRGPRPSLPVVLSELDERDFGKGKAVPAEVLTDRLRRKGLLSEMTDSREIFALFTGLSILVPNALRVSPPDSIWFATAPSLLMDAVTQQIREVPEEYRLGLEAILSPSPSHKDRPTTKQLSRRRISGK